MKKIFSGLLLCVITTGLLYAQKTPPHTAAEKILLSKDSAMQALIGTPYPDFEYKGDDGNWYSKKNMTGKKYYINFWFEACPPCMEEMDSLVALHNKLKNSGSDFISFTWDSPETIKRVRKNRELNFKIIPVTQMECYRLNFGNGFPCHIVVDEKGNIAYIGSLFNSSRETLAEVADILLNKKTVR